MLAPNEWIRFVRIDGARSARFDDSSCACPRWSRSDSTRSAVSTSTTDDDDDAVDADAFQGTDTVRETRLVDRGGSCRIE